MSQFMSQQENEYIVQKKRKRSLKKEFIIKSKKVRGEEHMNHAGKLVPSRTIGSDCLCNKHCFSLVNEAERLRIVKSFSEKETKDLQDEYLAGLINIESGVWRKCKQTNSYEVGEPGSYDSEQKPRKFSKNCSFYYKLRIVDTIGELNEVMVCQKAFIAIHGITRGRLRSIQAKISVGKSPKDERGKHVNRPRSVPNEIKELIRCHISSFKPRQSHYSIRKNPNKKYLPETLDTKIMFKMFKEEYQINVSYRVYWGIFKEYNLALGCPRSDTCSMCDTLDKQIEAENRDSPKERELKVTKELHLRKAEAFYQIKRRYKNLAKHNRYTVISFDYMQNLPVPHLRTNKIFYCRQLWHFVFGIHDLSNNDVSLYTYHEGIAKKGQNEVTSFLLDYLKKKDNLLKNLILFSDGCSGQNKNFVMMYFLYTLVHVLRMVKSITYIFPMRGHSLLPNDQDFVLIGAKKKHVTVQIPNEWDSIMESVRENPNPFKVEKVSNKMVYDVKKAVEPFFLMSRKGLVKLKNLRMYKIEQNTPFVKIRDSYNGKWRTVDIRNRRCLPKKLSFNLAYHEQIKIKKGKMNDLKNLFPFISEENKQFYSKLEENNTSASGFGNNDEGSYVDESDNSSGDEEF